MHQCQHHNVNDNDLQLPCNLPNPVRPPMPPQRNSVDFTNLTTLTTTNSLFAHKSHGYYGRPTTPSSRQLPTWRLSWHLFTAISPSYTLSKIDDSNTLPKPWSCKPDHWHQYSPPQPSRHNQHQSLMFPHFQSPTATSQPGPPPSITLPAYDPSIPCQQFPPLIRKVLSTFTVWVFCAACKTLSDNILDWACFFHSILAYFLIGYTVCKKAQYN